MKETEVYIIGSSENCVDKAPLIITPPSPPLNLRGGREGLKEESKSLHRKV